MKPQMRTQNFRYGEKILLLSLISKFKGTILSKKCDAKSTKEKDFAWRQIHRMFNSTNSTQRECNQLRNLWKNMKNKATSEFALRKESTVEDVDRKPDILSLKVHEFIHGEEGLEFDLHSINVNHPDDNAKEDDVLEVVFLDENEGQDMPIIQFANPTLNKNTDNPGSKSQTDVSFTNRNSTPKKSDKDDPVMKEIDELMRKRPFEDIIGYALNQEDSRKRLCNALIDAVQEEREMKREEHNLRMQLLRTKIAKVRSRFK